MSRLPFVDTVFPDQPASAWLTAATPPGGLASIPGVWRRGDLALAAEALASHFEQARRTGAVPDPWSLFAWAALRLRLGEEAEATTPLELLEAQELMLTLRGDVASPPAARVS